MRSIPFYPLMVLILIGLGTYLGCDPSSLPPLADGFQEVSGDGAPLSYEASIPQRTASTLLIGSFNLKRFGPSKLGDSWVMDRLAAIISRFDVIALQEITSLDQRTLPILVDLINSHGVQYSYAISPRIGREGTGYYEQYAFVFDTSRVAGGAEYCYVVADDEDMLHREPFVGRFRSLYPNQPFSFSLINVHTDPDEVSTEIGVLANLYKNVRQFEYPEDDVILLGDLNVDPSKLGPFRQIPGLVHLIEGVPTNTRKNRTIDNFIVDRTTTLEFTGRVGTIDLEKMFQVELRDAERLSDHLPIWAEFTAGEASRSATATAAGQGPTVVR